jgi:hypothetical protein
MAKRRSLTPFFDALSDLRVREKIKQQEISKLFEFDKFEGKTIFKAKVLTGCETGHQREDTTNPDNLYFPIVLRILDISDSIIPDPKDATTTEEKSFLIGNHPIAYSDRPYNTKLGFVPRAGQIVDCYYIDPVNKRNLVYIYPQEDSIQDEAFCGGASSLRDSFGAGTGILGDLTKAESWPEMESIFNSVEPTQTPVSGTGLSAVSNEANAAIDNWQSGALNETNATAKPFLTNYWNNLGMDANNAIQKQYAWSAAFVSYMVKSDSSFPKSSKHFYYTRDSLFNRTQGKTSGWLAYKLGKDKVSVKVGDIFVRNTNEDTNGHGDIVYKITGDKAYMVGGNVYSSQAGSTSTSHGVTAKEVTTVISIKSVEQASGGYGNYKYIVKKL